MLKEQNNPKIPINAASIFILVYNLSIAVSLIIFKEWIDYPYDVMYYFNFYMYLALLVFNAFMIEYLFYKVVWITYQFRKLRLSK